MQRNEKNVKIRMSLKSTFIVKLSNLFSINEISEQTTATHFCIVLKMVNFVQEKCWKSHALSETEYKKWFRRLRDNDFNVRNL